MNPVRKAVVGAALAGAALTGGALGAALVNTTATAQTGTSTTTPAQSTPAPDSARPPFDPAKGGHVGTNGTKEELLTGDTAEKVKAAALGAVPGGTVERVENDAEGSAYEAHMTKADGSHVTVKVDAGFNVTGTEEGHGPR
ncbi:MAG: PepSY domain-containing protein [Actinomycetota bacterium]|nr:PepSY domain-containing protein [Actinomycetota bacterium]